MGSMSIHGGHDDPVDDDTPDDAPETPLDEPRPPRVQDPPPPAENKGPYVVRSLIDRQETEGKR
jgi:hypothetical protein